ncbi:MAG: PorV/PorQ family protein, partial [candidate division KSB1 bacterium]|nr:PorV/PorQ family protein [candidate division KSB1 bacterium]
LDSKVMPFQFRPNSALNGLVGNPVIVAIGSDRGRLEDPAGLLMDQDELQLLVSEAAQALGVEIRRTLLVDALMFVREVIVVQPSPEGLVDVLDRRPMDVLQDELSLDKPEQALDLAFCLGLLAIDQADPQPTNLKLGFAYKLLDLEYNKLTLALDANKLLVTRHKDGTSDPVYKALFTSWYDEPQKEEFKKIIPHIGAEYWYSNLIALRAGYWYDEEGKVKPWTFGFGLRYSLYQFDFGYIAAGEGHPLTDTMRFSLMVGF